MDTSAFLIALAVVYLVPGPDMLLLFQTGARQGVARRWSPPSALRWLGPAMC